MARVSRVVASMALVASVARREVTISPPGTGHRPERIALLTARVHDEPLLLGPVHVLRKAAGRRDVTSDDTDR